MDRGGFLNPAEGGAAETVRTWFGKQTDYEARFVENMECVKVSVRLRMSGGLGKGLAYCGRGVICLNAEGWRYDGELKGREVSLFFPLSTVPAVPFDPNDNFQIYSKGEIYVFTPEENPAACAKYALLGECVYRRFASPSEMT
jgi:hypothetical protein